MDINAISQLAGASAAAPTVSVVSVAPDDAAVERFSQAIRSPDGVDPAGSLAPAMAAPGTAPVTLGDAILSGLDGLSTRVRENWSDLREPLAASGELTTAGLINYQVKFLEFQVLYEFYSKGVSKSVQDIENSLKTQ